MVVSTSRGVVSGFRRDLDGPAHFRGVPFAQPISCENRLGPPQPVVPWNGELDCSRFGPACWQSPSGGVGGSLFGTKAPHNFGAIGDGCLNLNVCTPNPGASSSLPVLVWVHGGANKEGSNSECGFLQPGEAWAALGVVGVSLNYRTGLHGFLHLPEARVTNNALRDLIAGLEWIHAEISSFGGDPANVCLLGESAGAVNIASLLASPKARPGELFHKAVLSSGGPKAFRAGPEYGAVLEAFRAALREEAPSEEEAGAQSQQRLAA